MGDYKAQRKASAIDGQNIKWNWGDDWPDALDVISRGVQGRPLSKIFSILDLLDELNHGSYCRRPRPGKPGGKPLAATGSSIVLGMTVNVDTGEVGEVTFAAISSTGSPISA